MVTWPSLNAAKLGNQLFGIAATLSRAAEYVGERARFPPWKSAPFFSLPADCFGEIPPANKEYEQPSLPYARITSRRDTVGTRSTIEGTCVEELRGNFISPKFFAGHESLIREAFAPAHPRPRTDCIALHVRRGDYVGGPYVQLERDYYERQMAVFSQEVPGARFLCFSDDVPLCRAMFAHRSDVGFALGCAEDDLITMSLCAGHIVANSTFSWWGARLSGLDNVIRPRHYHTEAFRAGMPHIQKWENEDFWPGEWRVGA